MKSLKVNGELQAALQPVVREEDCVGCDLCSKVCPVDDCVSMVPIETGRPHITWNELIQKRPDVLNWEKMEEYRKEAKINIH